MEVIKNRKTSSVSEVEAVAHAVRCFYTEYGEYLVLYSDFRTDRGSLSQPTVVDPLPEVLGLFLDPRCIARCHVLRFHIAHIRNVYK